MRIKGLFILILLVLVLTGCEANFGVADTSDTDGAGETTPIEATPTPTADEIEDVSEADDDRDTFASETPYDREAKRDLLALMMAYPNHIAGIERADGFIYVVMESGSRIVYDDMQSKDFGEKLANADLQDMMELAYPLGDIVLLLEGDFDPGRIRNYDLLMEVYGGSQSAIEANLEHVQIDAKTYQFNGENGVAFAMAAVFAELDDIISDERVIEEFVYPLASTYYYRVIAGTDRLSLHSFGIAIDLKNVKTDYWRDATREQGQARLDVFPREIVAVFEENGFIWGGKWAHFDLLHFEYRPELIAKAKYFIEQVDGEPWYQGYPITDETMKLVEIIDDAFNDG
ncbi:MAG: M15 family metallopeptidase [Clostridia bacterium]|nr:M15 family metallopeptidase [Clostridia bacterium]MBT7122007.1 M15 family metallopeptidase [Clostridia bacterium]